MWKRATWAKHVSHKNNKEPTQRRRGEDADFSQKYLREVSLGTERNAVLQLFKDRGMAHKTSDILKIERIQNERVFNAFEGCEEGKNTQYYLFHGARRNGIKGIVSQGHDFRLGGANGKRYGVGAYFALYSSYSESFCGSYMEEDGKGGTRSVAKMILSRVKVGEWAKGEENMRRPPPKVRGDDNGILFDSCVNRVEDPSIFVVFDNRQAYPMYLLTLQAR